MANQIGVISFNVLTAVGAGLTLQRLDSLSALEYPSCSTGLRAQYKRVVPPLFPVAISDWISISSSCGLSFGRLFVLCWAFILLLLTGGYSSFLMPVALGAMGYCYMWWKGLSLSDVMFVTKNNMANAVSTVSKQLENVSDELVATERHLSKGLENLDWKLDKQKEISKLIADDVSNVMPNLNQIGYGIKMIHQTGAGLEGTIDQIDEKQDITNLCLHYLCQVSGGTKDGTNANLFQDIEAKLGEQSGITYEDTSLKGLQFFTETDSDPKEKSVLTKSSMNVKKENENSKNQDFTGVTRWDCLRLFANNMMR